jgi:L-iditol 2-dehydrogenase
LLANIIIKPGKIELWDIKTPSPTRGELLVQIKAALTCGTDLKAFRRGHHVIPMPGVFGHEFSGIVAAVGKGVKKFKEGDPVMAVHSAPCLKCRYCKKGLYNLCEYIMNTKVLGAFAEYILLPPHIVRQNVFRKPKKISFEEAAFLEPLSCVVHGMSSLNVKKDDHALVIGAGPIGLLHVLLLKKNGAQVTLTDKHNKKLQIAKKFGADLILRNKIGFPPSPAPLPSREGRHTPIPLSRVDIPSPLVGEGKGEGFLGFDHVFECTGMPEVWESSINYVRRGGTVVLFGGCKSGTTVTYDTERIHYDELTLRGVFHFAPSDVKKAYKILSKGTLGVSRLISGRYPLTGIQRAFEKLAQGEGIKYAVIP